MKKLSIFILLFMSISASAQTKLKVTAINASMDNLYNQWANKFLGKTMSITFYDNSVKLSVNDLETFLKQTSNGSYTAVMRESEGERTMGRLTVNTSLSIVTSATFRMTINELKGSRRTAYVEMTGKRF